MNDAKEIRLHELHTAGGVKIVYFADQAIGSGSAIVMLNPPSWALACSQTWAIAESILQKQGTKGIDIALGSKASDADSFMTELIAGIRDVVKQTVDDEQIQLFIADVQSFQLLMREYNATPENCFTTLQMVVGNAVFPIGRLEALERNFPVAAHAYLTGSLLRLAALQEYALRSGNEKDFSAFTSFADYAAQTGRAALRALPGINDARVTPIEVQRRVGGCHSIGERRECWWSHRFAYSVDGFERKRSRNSTDDGVTDAQLREALERERVRDLSRAQAELGANVLNPVSHTVELLERIAEMQFEHR
jgi:hypothetical protein